MTRFLRLLLTGAGLAGAASAQTDASHTLDALLAEVRQLRVAVERSISIGPRIQLLLQRAQIQQTAVTRLSRDLDDIRSQIANASNEASVSEKLLADYSERMRQEQNPAQKQGLEDRLRGFKLNNEAAKAREQQLQVRASEVATQLQAEQSKLDALEARLDALDKQLDAPPRL